MKTIPLRIISTKTVVATSARPMVAANHWISVANGPYTDDCDFHMSPTASVYGECAPSQASGLVRYGLPPCAVIRPYAA